MTERKGKAPTGIFWPVLFGCLVIASFLVGFGIWAATAPIAGASIAQGVVAASGENNAVQHLEGGIVSEILVKKGDRVKQGQALVKLDETQAISARNRIGKSIVGLTARIERASSELEGSDTLKFSQNLKELAQAANTDQALDQQQAEFKSRLDQHKSELNVMEEQVRAIEEEILGIGLQLNAEETKLDVIEAELVGKKKLLDQGLTSRTQYNELLRAQADIVGAIGSRKATIGQRRTTISEIRERQTTAVATRKAAASKEISDLRLQIEDMEEQLSARSDILGRMVINAPEDGIIVTLTKNTIGSVIQPGETVLEILPTSEELVISARIAPQDIDAVRVGQNANIRFSALNLRTTPEVPAAVEYISADRLVDAATQEPYFEARLKLSSNLPNEIKADQIYAGMPVEAFINTGERTFLEYMAKPIQDSFSRAFTED